MVLLFSMLSGATQVLTAFMCSF